MKNKKWPYIIGILIALILQFIGISSGISKIRTYGGICILLAAVLLSLCFNRLYRISYEKEFPDLVHQEKVEYRDERNTQLRNMAKAKSADLIQWVIIAVACLVFFTGGPFWITIALGVVYTLRYGLEWYYLNKYQKEM